MITLKFLRARVIVSDTYHARFSNQLFDMQTTQFLRLPKWNDVLLEIYRSPEKYRYCEKLNRSVKASLTHLREILHLLAVNNLIEILPSPKIKRIVLTEKGRRVALSVMEVRNALSTP